jgi:nucleoside-triphosphatase THEP1
MEEILVTLRVSGNVGIVKEELVDEIESLLKEKGFDTRCKGNFLGRKGVDMTKTIDTSQMRLWKDSETKDPLAERD